MSSSYILISSAYRDRLLYPNPANFIVPFKMQNNVPKFNVFNTINPLSIFPIYNFCWTNFKDSKPIFKTKIIGGGGSYIKVSIEDVCIKLLGISTSLDETMPGYLKQFVKNCINILNNYSVRVFVENTPYITKIVSFSPIYSTIETLEVIPFQIDDEIEIINTSELFKIIGGIQTTTQSEILINGIFNTKLSLPDGPNFYLYNITINEIRKSRLDYNNFQLITSPAFSSDVSFTDKYLLYNDIPPTIIGEIKKFPNQKYFIENCLLNFSYIHKGNGYHKFEKVYLVPNDDPIGNETNDHSLLKIDCVDESGGIIDMNISEMGCQEFKRSKSYKVVPIIKRDNIDYAVIFVNNISTAFRCHVKDKKELLRSDIIGSYFTCFLLSPLYIANKDNIYTSPNNVYPVKIINSNNEYSLQYSQEKNGVFGIEKVINVDNDEIIILVQKISSELLYRFNLYENLPYEIKNSTQFADATHFCLQTFIKDGVVPMNFTGTYFTQSQMCCYEMTILNLILPNTQINSLDSLLTSGFPYVILEISNVSQPNAHNKNAIYSNNPATINCTFICAISDVNNPLTTKFIKINSSGAIQTIKFSPIDNLKIRILLPSGETLQYIEEDFFPPSYPNDNLQIDILMEIKKL